MEDGVLLTYTVMIGEEEREVFHYFLQREAVITVKLDVQKGEFPVIWQVFEKNLDEINSKGEIKIQVETDSPNIVQLDTFSFTNENNFDVSTLKVEEDESKQWCDKLHCYQDIVITFDYLNCSIETDITMNFHSNCSDYGDESVQSNCDTTVPPHDIVFVVYVMAEDICGVVQEKIEVEGSYDIYMDWKFSELYFSVDKDGLTIFPDPASLLEPLFIGDFAYFHFDLDVKDDKITMVGSVITKVVFNGFVLYDDEDGGSTLEGDKATFDMGNHNDVDKTRMSFQIINEHVPLNYGETTSEPVETEVSFLVSYLHTSSRRIIQETLLKKSNRRMITGFVVQHINDPTPSTSSSNIGSGLIAVIIVLSTSFVAVIVVTVVILSICLFLKLKKGRKDTFKFELLLKE